MRLLDDCEPTAELVEYLREVLVSRGKSTKDWRCIMNKRIGLSYRSCSFGLVWLDDKLEQVHRTATQLGIQRHLPLLAATPASDAAAAKKLWAAARQQVALNSSFVVKPRHGSNSKYVAMWPCPAQANEEAILESIEAALCAEDPSWRRESWNQNAVTKGAVLQPLYALMADVLETGEKDLTKLQKPLELKVQVLFGEPLEEDRRLKVGELVEVKSWMKKHEQMGLKRLRCKALSDGAIGWATVVGNAGTVFLEVRQGTATAAAKILGRYPGRANAEITAKLLGQLLYDEDRCTSAFLAASAVMSADRLWAQGILEYLPEVQKNQQSTAGLDSFEASVNLDASDPQRVFFLATKLYHAGRHQEAESCYYKVLDMLPESGHGYLELVLFLESTGRREEAREVAQRAIERGALWANEWQRCPIFVSGLTSKPWWSREEFPWANELEGAFPEIKAWDMERASQDGDIIAPGGEWREFLLYSAQDQSPATANPEVLKAFPKTCELLENLLPGAVAMAKFGVGEIILSAIAPGTKLTPHCASSNVRLTCHLGVICPEGARVRVGPTWGTWEERDGNCETEFKVDLACASLFGVTLAILLSYVCHAVCFFFFVCVWATGQEEGRCIFFDDSYEHEVVNDADGVRIVLLIRFWHPELPSERWRDTLDAGMEERFCRQCRL
eukprot:g8812.t1